MADTSATTPKTPIPEALEPSLPEDVNSALHTIADGLGTAVNLAKGYGSYDEESGDPLDSDAETEVLCLAALECVGSLEETIAQWQRRHISFVMEAYKNHLYYDASKDFEYHGGDEQTIGDELAGMFEGTYQLAATLIPGLDKTLLMKKGTEEVVDGLRHEIPLLRAEAAKPYRRISPMERTYNGERERNQRVVEAHEELLEKERILDLLSYHLQEAEAESDCEVTPTQAPLRFQLILYYEGQNPEDPDQIGAILDRFATTEVAGMRKEDLESGARAGSIMPRQEDLDGGNLVIEEKS